MTKRTTKRTYYIGVKANVDIRTFKAELIADLDAKGLVQQIKVDTIKCYQYLRLVTLKCTRKVAGVLFKSRYPEVDGIEHRPGYKRSRCKIAK